MMTRRSPFFFILLLSLSLAGYARAIQPVLIENYKIEQPLSAVSPDIEQGKRLVVNVNKGNCLACHQIPEINEDMQGTVGPSLASIGSRLSEADLRLRVVNMKKINPFTIMPAYYRSNDELNRVAERYNQHTLLDENEVEHVIAYLKTLKASP